MKYIGLGIAALLTIIGLTLAPVISDKYEIANDRQRQLNAIEIERQRMELDYTRGQLPIRAATNTGLSVLLLAGIGGALYTIYHITMRGQARKDDDHRYVTVDGVIIPKALIDNGRFAAALEQRLLMSGEALIERARQSANVPHVYSPHTSYQYESTQLPAPAPQPLQLTADTIDAEPVRPSIDQRPGEPILAALHRANIICRSGDSLHVGNTATGEPVYLERATWGSLAIGGKSRTGKSSRVLYLLAQAHMIGYRIAVCDPHAAKESSLVRQLAPIASSYLMPPASDVATIKTRIKQIWQIKQDRLAGKSTDRWPIVLVVDELTNLILNEYITQDELDMLLSVGNEGAGVGVHTILIGHNWSASCLGDKRGAAFRQATTHKIAHRSDASAAYLLLPDMPTAKQCLTLPTGTGIYMDDTGEPVQVDCPMITAADLEYAASQPGRWNGKPKAKATPDDLLAYLLTNDAEKARPNVSPTTVLPPSNEADGHADGDAGQTQDGYGTDIGQTSANNRPMQQDAKIAQVITLMRERATEATIIRTIWGVEPQGRAGKTARDELTQIMATIAARLAAA